MIQIKIGNLSQDEDCQQDLWLKYLEDPTSDLSSNFQHIQNTNTISDLMVNSLVLKLNASSTDRVQVFLEEFTEIERSIMVLLILGLTKEQISKYKMIEMLPLQQLINNVSTHPAWGKFFVKEKTKRRREIRTK